MIRRSPVALLLVFLAGCGVPTDAVPAAVAPESVAPPSVIAGEPTATASDDASEPISEQPSEDDTLIEDSFTDAFSGWDVVEHGQGLRGAAMGYAGGVYRIEVRPPAGGATSAAPFDTQPPAGDIAVRATVRVRKGPANVGVFCRGSSDGREAYFAGIGSNGGYGITRAGGNAPRPLTPPESRDPALRSPAAWNTVELECLGDENADHATLRLLVNDHLVAEVIDPDPLDAGPRAAGVFVAAHRRARVQAWFDHFVVRRQSPMI